MTELTLTDDQKGIVNCCRAIAEGGTGGAADASLTEQGGGVHRIKSTISEAVEWKPLESPSPFVAMHMQFNEEANKKAKRSIATGKAEAEIDTSAAEAAAWCWDFCSNERMRIDKEAGHHARLIVGREGFAEQTLAVVKRMPFPFNKREGVSRQVLSKSGDKIIIAMESTDDDVDYGRKLRRRVRLVGTTFLAFEMLSERSSRFTIIQYLDAGGHIPVWVVNIKLPHSLSISVELRDEFARDDEIDEIERGMIAALMGWKRSTKDRTSEEGEKTEVRGASSGTG